MLIGALSDGVADAARPALMFGLGTMVVALAVSFLIPRRPATRRVSPDEEPAIELLDALAAYEPVEPGRDPALDPRNG